MYISLHNHSTYSIFDGYSKIPDLVARVKSLGQTAVSLTEHGTLSSVLPFYKECRKNDIKPIIGNEFYFCPDVTIRDRKQMYHLIVLAQNNVGYRNLLQLDTLAYQNFYYKPRIDFGMLEEHKEGLIVLSACMGSILNAEAGEHWCQQFHQLLGDSFYLEIQANTMEDQKVYNRKIIALSETHGIPLVITSDAHYPSQEDAKYHKLWVNLNKGENDYYPTDDFFVMSEEDIYARTGYLPKDIIDKAIENSGRIAESCDVTIEVTGNHFPVFPVDDQMEALKDICREGWKQKILPFIPKEKLKVYQERLLEEIAVLDKCNYLNYLLITHDILNWCKEHDILTGIGRGSCGGSLVCYLMNITKIDPIEHNLLFQRFVNVERVSAADIDDDIEDVHRQDVIDYIREKYGEVYNIRTFNYLGIKGSIQRACQALHIPARISTQLFGGIESYEELDEVIKGLPLCEQDIYNVPQGDAWAAFSITIAKAQGIVTRDMVEHVLDVAKHFNGLLHAFGCHASAVMIFPDSPTNYNPIEKQKDTFVAAYDYHDLENMNLVKLDILGLRNLSVIHDTLRLLTNPPDIENLPLDDAEIYRQYAEGTTKGIFQVESPGMRQFAKQMHVSCFDDVVALIALYRPGPLDSGMAQQYIDGKNGGEVQCLHPALESILGPTHQVIVYQEQVMKIAQELAGFTLGEADTLRKVIGRKELDKDEHGKTPVDYAVEKFVAGAVVHGVSEEVAAELGRQITACGRYIFNRSHAAAYGYTSYITAYLKCHHPLEYMCSLLNSTIGNIEKTVEYIKEVQRMDIKLIPPNLSLCKEKFAVVDDSIAYALTAIKGIGKNLCTEHTKSYLDIIDSNSKGVTEALIKAGALDYLGFPRGVLLANLVALQDALKRKQQCQQKIAENKQKLSEASTEKDQRKYRRQLEQWQQKLAECEQTQAMEPEDYDEIAGEVEVLGFSFKKIPKVKTGTLVKIYKKNDKNGHEMGWLTMDTAYGEYRCTVFARGWAKVASHVKKGESYKFVVNDEGILEEISMGRTVVKTNERRKF
jgi:DNA-directed DNA polymerase III (polc)